MTAPEPTAGEREVPCPECGGSMRFCECMDDPFAPVPHPLGPDGFTCLAGDVAYDRLSRGNGHTQAAFPPAVAASTGTSEDVETRCIVGLSDAERDDWAEVLMRRWGCEMDDESAYDNACRDVDALWHLVAAQKAAARAEEREALVVLDGLLRRWETTPALRRATAAAEVRRTLGEHLARAAREAR